MARLADRTRETTATTGTGAITLAGAVSGYQSFATAFASSSALVEYCIVSGTLWEVGRGVFDGTTGLTRDTVTAGSSGAGTFITLAGTSDVFISANEASIDGGSRGRCYAMSRGLTML